MAKKEGYLAHYQVVINFELGIEAVSSYIQILPGLFHSISRVVASSQVIFFLIFISVISSKPSIWRKNGMESETWNITSFDCLILFLRKCKGFNKILAALIEKSFSSWCSSISCFKNESESLLFIKCPPLVPLGLHSMKYTYLVASMTASKLNCPL